MLQGKLPRSGFYAVIFSSVKSNDLEGYAETDSETMALAARQPGYMGFESVSNGSRNIFISYWESREAIDAWSRNAIHKMAKAQAAKWYARYLSQVCLVENSVLFEG